MTPKELHDELKRLAAKASQGEWRIYRQECPTYDDVVNELLQLFALTKPTIPALIMLEAGGKCPALTGCGPTSEANAEFIAALRNNLPTILRALSALEGVKGALEKIVAEGEAGLLGEAPNVANIARSALSKLKEAGL